MESAGHEPTLGSRMLSGIREGMAVYGPDGDRVGTVERVYLGGADEETIARGAGPATAPDPDRGSHWLLDDLARGFASDRVPDVLRARLLQHGFLRVDGAGLFAADRYVMPDQIARVGPDGVHLQVEWRRLPAA